MQPENQIDFENFKAFKFEEFGFDLYWSPAQWVYMIFLNDQTYDFDPILMRELTQQIADLFAQFYLDQKIKIKKQEYQQIRKINFSDY